MKTTLGNDTAGSLNIYTAEPGGGLLGYATFPWWYADTPQLDGVVIHHASFPPTPRVHQPWPFDLGMTAVHEIGHWCGLYHTFQGGCDAPGDDIVDTAYEQNAATGCPLRSTLGLSRRDALRPGRELHGLFRRCLHEAIHAAADISGSRTWLATIAIN